MRNKQMWCESHWNEWQRKEYAMAARPSMRHEFPKEILTLPNPTDLVDAYLHYSPQMGVASQSEPKKKSIPLVEKVKRGIDL